MSSLIAGPSWHALRSFQLHKVWGMSSTAVVVYYQPLLEHETILKSEITSASGIWQNLLWNPDMSKVLNVTISPDYAADKL